MKRPNVELKNVKTFRGHEGIGLNANVYINGVKCLFVIDEANGGEMIYEENIQHKDPKLVSANIQLMDDYIAMLPEQKFTYGDKTFSIKVNRDIFINDILVEMKKKKNQRKMEKLMQTAILIGIPNSDRYSYFNFKRALSTIPRTVLQAQVALIKFKNCKNGVVILNTNLADLGITV